MGHFPRLESRKRRPIMAIIINTQEATKNIYELSKLVERIDTIEIDGVKQGIGGGCATPEEEATFVQECAKTAKARKISFLFIIQQVAKFKNNDFIVDETVTIEEKDYFINYKKKEMVNENTDIVAKVEIKATLSRQAIKELLIQQVNNK